MQMNLVPIIIAFEFSPTFRNKGDFANGALDFSQITVFMGARNSRPCVANRWDKDCSYSRYENSAYTTAL